VLDQVRGGHQARPPEPDIHEPKIWVHENHLEREPRARNALLVHEARRADGAVGLGRVAEVQEELVDLAEFSAGEAVALLPLRRLLPRGTAAEEDDQREVGGDDGDVEKVEVTHGRGRGRKPGRTTKWLI